MSVVQLFWHGNNLSPYELMCFQSFLDFGHSVHVYAYDDLNVPIGVELRDAGEIMPASSYFDYVTADGRTTASAFSNIFRYTLLYKRGGWWVDADVVCLTSDVPDYELFFAWESPDLIGSAVIFAQAGHPLMAACANAAIDTVAKTGANMPWGTIGPKLLTTQVKEMGYADEARPPCVCYPIPWPEAIDFLRPAAADRIARRTRNSTFVHLWNEVLMGEHISKTQRPPDGSYLRALADRQRVAGWKSDLPEAVVETLAERNAARREITDLRRELETKDAQLTEAFAAAAAAKKKSRRKLETKNAQLTEAFAAAAAAEKKLHDVHASRSWKITQPIRLLSKALSGARSKKTRSRQS